MEFYTQYRDHVHCISNPGTRMHQILSPVVDRNGHLTLEVSGEENIYDMIQSHKDSCDIHVLLKQFAEGDTEALSRRQAVYADVRDMPKTYAEMLQATITAERVFADLPLDVRAKFNHSVSEFIAGMDKPDFLEKLGKSVPSSVSEQSLSKSEDVKSVEVKSNEP